MSRKLYLIDDYVFYIGNHAFLDPLLREQAIGRLLKLNKKQDFWEVELEISTVDKLFSVIDLIRPIFTEETHLRKLGFKLVNGKNPFFEKDGIIITRQVVEVIDPSGKRVQNDLGFCLIDPRQLSIDILQSYILDGEFNISDFYKTYESMLNLNDVFKVVKDKNIEFNEREILIHL